MNFSTLASDIVQVFGVAFGGTTTLIWLLRHLSFLQTLQRREEGERSLSKPRFFRLGGIALWGGFLGALWLDDRLAITPSLLVLVTGASAATLVGLLDDMRPLHWRWQLLTQILLGALLYGAGMTIEWVHLGDGQIIDFSWWPGLALLVTLAWVVLVMNALNWIDGVDGLMGGVLMVVYLTIFLLSLQPEVNQPTVALLASMFLGATLAFSVCNWFPAAILAGTSGATFAGFVVAALSLYAGTKVATALLVLGIPILDAGAVIVSRLFHGKSPFLPDKQHFHHILIEFGWSSREVALFYTFLASIMSLLALTTHLLEKILVMVMVAFFFFGGMVIVQSMLARRKVVSQE